MRRTDANQGPIHRHAPSCAESEVVPAYIAGCTHAIYLSNYCWHYTTYFPGNNCMQLFDDSAPEAPLPQRKQRIISVDSRQARRFGLVCLAIAAVVIPLASSRAHYKLAAHAPNDMPTSSRWLFTGRNPDNNVKVGLWADCWINPAQT